VTDNPGRRVYKQNPNKTERKTMQLYAVTIRAIVEKTITLAASDVMEAANIAHEAFTLEPENSERYEQDTLMVEAI
jgi:hypothetical protein